MKDLKKLTTFSFSNLSKYRNAIMGMQIISILMFHYAENCNEAGIGFTGLVFQYYKYIHSSGVDIFLFISGLGLYYSWKNKPVLKSFFHKRLKRILVPYFIVAIPGWFWMDFIYYHESIVVYLKDLFFISFFTEGERFFWYILMCLTCYLIFPILNAIIDKFDEVVMPCLCSFILCIIVTIIINTIRLYAGNLYDNLSIALTRFVPFILGIMAGKLSYHDKKISIFWILGLLCFALWLVGPGDIIGVEIKGVYAITLLNLCLSFLIIHVIDFIDDLKISFLLVIYKAIKGLFDWFGQYSLEIYLVHMVIRRMMNYSGYELYEIPNETMMIIISLSLSYLLKKLTNFIYQNQKRLVHRNIVC